MQVGLIDYNRMYRKREAMEQWSKELGRIITSSTSGIINIVTEEGAVRKPADYEQRFLNAMWEYFPSTPTMVRPDRTDICHDWVMVPAKPHARRLSRGS
jgi:hypothetical protein